MIKCPTCEGSGKQVCQPRLLTSESWVEEEAVEITCVVCDGKGEITQAQMDELDRMDNLWCKCGNPSGDTKFWDNGEHPECSKHCWTCQDCGKIVQVG